MDRKEILDELIHDIADAIALDVCHNGGQEEWLIKQGWSIDGIDRYIAKHQCEHKWDVVEGGHMMRCSKCYINRCMTTKELLDSGWKI